MATMMVIHDDRAGSGDSLAFPNMSTCCAVICVLPNTLVGIHKTLGEISGKQLRLFNYARDELINGATVHQIVMAGWYARENSTKHSPAVIRDALNCQNVPTFFYDYATHTVNRKDSKGKKTVEPAHKTHSTGFKMQDLCTFAQRDGTAFPKVSVKRSSKVANTIDGAALYAKGTTSQFKSLGSVDEAITYKNDHLINRNQFKQI
ncbi:MAG: hypothetical protein AAFN27_01150 [Pseudomonadota bacterium]